MKFRANKYNSTFEGKSGDQKKLRSELLKVLKHKNHPSRRESGDSSRNST